MTRGVVLGLLSLLASCSLLLDSGEISGAGDAGPAGPDGSPACDACSGTCYKDSCIEAEDASFVAGASGTDDDLCLIDSPCQTLSAGISAAATRNVANVVVLQTQTFTEHIDYQIDREGSLTILGNASTLRPSSSPTDRILQVIGPDLTIRDLNLNAFDLPDTIDVATVYASSDSRLNLESVTIEQAPNAGIVIEGGAVVAATNLTVQDSGNAGIIVENASLHLRSSTIQRNQGNGIATGSLGANQLIVESSKIIDNDSTGVSIRSTVLSIRNTLIADNQGDGMSLGMGTVAAGDVVFELNTVVGHTGAAIDCETITEGPNYSVRGNLLALNIATENCSTTPFEFSGTTNIAPFAQALCTPQFEDADDGDYRLSTGDCIDIGALPSDLVRPGDEDPDGTPRPQGLPDLGAFERAAE